MYVVAATADNEDFVGCQILGEHVMNNSPDITVSCIIKDKSEWEAFIDSVVRTYGFPKKQNPIIYTLEGKCIGGAESFKRHIDLKYGITLNLTKETLRNRARLNGEQNAERMRKLGGETTGEAIHKTIS